MQIERAHVQTIFFPTDQSYRYYRYLHHLTSNLVRAQSSIFLKSCIWLDGLHNMCVAFGWHFLNLFKTRGSWIKRLCFLFESISHFFFFSLFLFSKKCTKWRSRTTVCTWSTPVLSPYSLSQQWRKAELLHRKVLVGPPIHDCVGDPYVALAP